MSHLINCSFSRVTLLWCLKSEGKIELSWPEYIDVRCWQSSGWIWLEIFKLSLRLIHVGTVYLIYMYVDILSMTIYCDGILRIEKNGMSQKNFHNCKKVTSPAELKIGRSAKSCYNHWKWIQMTKVRKHMDLPCQTTDLCSRGLLINPPEIRKTCSAKPSPSPKSTQNRALWEPSPSAAPAGSRAPRPSPCGSTWRSAAASSAPLHTRWGSLCSLQLSGKDRVRNCCFWRLWYFFAWPWHCDLGSECPRLQKGRPHLQAL